MNQKMLIVIAACVALIGASEVSGSEDEWNKNYEIVFGSSGTTVADSKMMAALMSLEKDASAGQVDPKLSEKVHFWSNALSNIEFRDCTEQHLNELRHEAENRRLMDLAQRTFLKLCSAYHTDLNNKMSSCLRDDMPFVRKIQTSFDYYLMKQRDLRSFMELARKIAGVSSHISGDELMQGWRAGFCKSILIKMDLEQQMVYHSRFIDLVTKLGHSQIDYTVEPVRGWIKVVDMCKRLDCIVRNHVYKGSCTDEAHRV